MEIANKNYKQLVNRISDIYLKGQKKAVIAINSHLVETYWQIGQYVVEFEQGGKAKAEYGKGLLASISKDLSLIHGKGFSVSNLKRMRQFYATYPIGAELPHQLSWTHLVELLKIDDPLERSFYEKQTILENWSTTELIRQKNPHYFYVWLLQKINRVFINWQNKDKLLNIQPILSGNLIYWIFYRYRNLTI